MKALKSYFPHPSLSRFLHTYSLGQDQEEAAKRQRGARESLGGNVAARSIDDGARYGRTGQGGKRDDGEDHAHAHAEFPQVGCQEGQGGGEHALDAACEDTVQCTPDVEGDGGLDGHPAEYEDGGDAADGDEDVDGADLVGQVVGQKTADEADAIEHQEQVEGLLEGEGVVEDVAGKGGEVVDGKVQAPEELPAKSRTFC